MPAGVSPDWVAIATLAVAGMTLLLALATVWLGVQAKAGVSVTRALEVARRGELQILEADPLLAQPLPWDYDAPTGQPLFKLGVTNVGDRPVTAITATIRSNDHDASQSPGWDALAPGQQHVFTYRLSPFLRYTDPADRRSLEAMVGHCEVVIESHGIFGQRVIQSYRLRVDRIAAHLPDAQWYLERQEIVPCVDGATSAVTIFHGAAE